jgi:hypothetical protein
MSPGRPKLTTSTAVTTRHPKIGQSSRLPLPGCSRSTPIPRKASGSAISMIEVLIDASKAPNVVFDSATHLQRGPGAAPSLAPIPPRGP